MLTINSLSLEEADEEQYTGAFSALRKGIKERLKEREYNKNMEDHPSRTRGHKTFFQKWKENREEKKQNKLENERIKSLSKVKDSWDKQPRTTEKQVNTVLDSEKKRHENRLNQLNQVQVSQPSKNNTGRNLKIAGAVGAGVLGLRALEKRNQERQKS